MGELLRRAEETGADEVLVEGEGMVGDPGGERGDLILYVIEDGG